MNADEEKIRNAVNLLAEAHNAKISVARRERYVRKLSQIGAPMKLVFRALDNACDVDRMPTPAMLCEQVNAEHARATALAKSGDVVKHLSPDQKRAADKALLRSIVWLHLVKSWQPHDFANSMFARRMGRDERDYGEFLRVAVAHENWTRESIDEWMQLALKRADNDEQNARRIS